MSTGKSLSDKQKGRQAVQWDDAAEQLKAHLVPVALMGSFPGKKYIAPDPETPGMDLHVWAIPGEYERPLEAHEIQQMMKNTQSFIWG